MHMNPKECKVALLAGGVSGERDISLSSGASVKSALEKKGYLVDLIDPASKEDLKRLVDNSYDVAFLALHGKGGEDGTMQGMLEILHMPYTGSGVLASALAMDKAKAKVIYRENDIATPPSVDLKAGQPYSVEEIFDEIGPRCVVKPASEGSTIGIEIVNTKEALAKAIEDAFEFDTVVVIEKYVKGMELTVAVLGNEDSKALPPIEITFSHEFFDFDAKYSPGGCHHICPARIDEEMTMRVKGIAEAAHNALGCRGVSRTDMIIDEAGTPWALETNTIPGMTDASLLPDAARVEGIEFPDLCELLLNLAME